MTMTLFDLIPYRIKSLRKKCGYSQGELARLSDCTQGQISHFENGRAFPGLETAVRLATAFGLTLGEFLAEKEPICAPPRPARDEEMVLWIAEKVGISQVRIDQMRMVLGEVSKY